MSRFLSSRLAAMESYVPGEQPQDRRYIKLNTNESPYPPPPGVLNAVGQAQMAALRLYSDPTCRMLREKLAQRYEVGTKNVFLANGSDEILNFAFMAYGERGAVFPDITYGFYKVFADLYGLTAEIVPLLPDFTVNVSRFCNQNKLVVLANPNAPTGIALSRQAVETIAAQNPDGIVLIDEAYVDFGAQSALPLLSKYNNLLVVQTYSKSRSMAGARLGFAFGAEEVIADLEKIKYATNPYNVNRLTQLAGTASLDEDAYTKEKCAEIIQTRDYVTKALRDLEFTVPDSLANFVFAKHKTMRGEALYKSLKQRGILVRHFSGERLEDYNRITIGSPEEMKIFIQTVREIIGGYHETSNH